MGPKTPDSSTDEGNFEAWEAIHNDPDYDPNVDSEEGFPDYHPDSDED